MAGKLFVVDPGHPCAAEAADVVANAGDHICVDTPDVFSRFRRAVTDTGLYKDSDRLAVKDDRRPLKQADYIYQGDVANKIDALTVDLAAAEQAYQQARRAADDIAAQRQRWRDRAAASRAICEQFPQWNHIDVETADKHADRLREQFEILLADHPDIEALSARAEECWSEIQTLMTRRGAIQTRRDDLDHRRTQLLELAERLSPPFVSEPLTELLHRYAAEVPVPLELLGPEPHRGRCSPRSAANASSCGRAVVVPMTNWPASSTLSTPRSPTRSRTTARCSTSGCTTTSRCAGTSTSANCPRPTSG